MTNGEYKEPTTKNNLASDRKDAVERLNAIKQFIGYDKDSEIVKATQKSLDMAIKALEQEPILDKVRAEIETKYGQCKLTEYIVQYDGICTSANDIGDIADILQIIDKHKSESED